MRSLGHWDVDISVREKLIDRAAAVVVLHLRSNIDQSVEMTPQFARTLARHLVEYANMADKKKRR